VTGPARRTGPRLRRRGGRSRARSSPEPLRLPEPEEREAYLVLDFALRAGEVLLSGGAGAADVTAAVQALARACGLRQISCDITFTSISLAYVRAPDVAPVTSMRVVRRRALDYTRVTEVHNLVDDVVAGRLDPAAGMRRLEQVHATGHPYRGWVVTAMQALVAAAIVVLLGGGLVVAAAAFASTVVVDRTNRRLDARGVPQFFQNAVGAFLATVAALLLLAADVGVRPALVVAGGIILLLPGSTLVGAVQDAITGYLVTASARALEVLILTAGIVTGVAFGLDVGLRFGIDMRILPASPFTLGQVPVQVLAAGVPASSSAAAHYTPLRTLLAAGVAGSLGWSVLLGTARLELSPAFASAAAAVGVGVVSYAFSRRQKAPPLVYVAAGIIPLLPGLTIYRGMLRFAEGDAVGGLVTLGNALTVGLALAAGVILGELTGQPRGRRWPAGRRADGPRLAGPLAARQSPDEDGEGGQGAAQRG
jgi:uncharacterized membrane protein YjjP (DUF1212 family)